MLVEHMIKDLHVVLENDAEAAAFEIGIARYKTKVGGEILFQRIGSYNWDDDCELFLNPASVGAAYGLLEEEITLGELLSRLEALPELHGFIPFARESVKLLPDGSTATINRPVWGTGWNSEFKVAYFYYGDPQPQP